jgi:predicted DNA-binding protein (MmcQ/YjbR family)
MTVDTVRAICRAMPGATEDLKWGADLAFSVGGKMFCVVNTEPPHQMSFKCTPDDFAELTEREGLIPAPYLARAMWVQQSDLAGETLDRRELQQLLQKSYDLVVAKLPKSKQPGAARQPLAKATKNSRATTTRAKRKRR